VSEQIRHLRTKANQEQEGRAQPRIEVPHEPKRDVPRRAGGPGPRGVLRPLLGMGGQALGHLLRMRSQGQPLDPETKAGMERSFGADLSDVRLHDDEAAHAASQALDADAFTHGNDVYLGSEKPPSVSGAGRALLAHELAHVVQQRRAGGRTAGVSDSRTGTFEVEAGRAAATAQTGGPVHLATSGPAPAIQRQERRRKRSLGERPAGTTPPSPLAMRPRPSMHEWARRAARTVVPPQPPVTIRRKPRQQASRAEAQAALEAFLKRALAAQGGRTLEATPQVREAVRVLFSRSATHWAQIDAWLAGKALPGDPAEFARQVARRLPSKIDSDLVEQLKRMPVQPKSTRLGRLRTLFERTAPGKRHLPEALRGPKPQERVVRGMEQLGKAQGREVTKHGPYSVNVLRLGRVAKGLPEAWRSPSRRRQPPARTYPEVESAIQTLVTPHGLVPYEWQQRLRQAEEDFASAGPEEEHIYRLRMRNARARIESFADAREVARALARSMDVAHQQGQASVTLRLGNNYNDVRNRTGIYSELRRIAILVRNRLPHRAPGVKEVNVYFGDKLVKRIILGSGSK
jgi:hypothetical protein